MESETHIQPDEPNREADRKLLWQGRIGPAFWTVACILSLTVNVILVVLLILLGRNLFAIKELIHQQLVGGLYYNFVLMDQAKIKTTVQVEDTIHVEDSMPVVFDLPLEQDTTVVLTKETPINNATIVLNGQPVPIDIVLRKGTPLNIHLDLTVPVSQTIPVSLDVPVNLTVPVEIPLSETELHRPFVGLQNVISPYYWELSRLPDSWEEAMGRQ
jgi:hypothetical protein